MSDKIDLSQPIEITTTIQIEDRETYDKLFEPQFEAEIVGGRWDGLKVVYEP